MKRVTSVTFIRLSRPTRRLLGFDRGDLEIYVI
jgi:hypothetical protein